MRLVTPPLLKKILDNSSRPADVTAHLITLVADSSYDPLRKHIPEAIDIIAKKDTKAETMILKQIQKDFHEVSKKWKLSSTVEAGIVGLVPYAKAATMGAIEHPDITRGARTTYRAYEAAAKRVFKELN
jgi:hypothetical protein